MTDRGKLIELVNNVLRCLPWGEISSHTAGDIADHLIANGVTVQKEAKLYWKPAKPGEWNLTCSACDSHLGCRENANYCPECGAKFVCPKAVAPQLKCVDTCVCCGEIIPEGQIVCPNCLVTVKERR